MRNYELLIMGYELFVMGATMRQPYIVFRRIIEYVREFVCKKQGRTRCVRTGLSFSEEIPPPPL